MEYEVNNAVPGIVMTIIRFCITISNPRHIRNHQKPRHAMSLIRASRAVAIVLLMTQVAQASVAPDGDAMCEGPGAQFAAAEAGGTAMCPQPEIQAEAAAKSKEDAVSFIQRGRKISAKGA